jgi:hypothetical protein
MPRAPKEGRCGVICVAAGEVKPFSEDIGSVLAAVRIAAASGNSLKLDPPQVRSLLEWIDRMSLVTSAATRKTA